MSRWSAWCKTDGTLEKFNFQDHASNAEHLVPDLFENKYTIPTPFVIVKTCVLRGNIRITVLDNKLICNLLVPANNSQIETIEELFYQHDITEINFGSNFAEITSVAQLKKALKGQNPFIER